MATQAKHTPGPWSQGIRDENDSPKLVTADDGTKYHRRQIIATFEGPAAEANAAFVSLVVNSHDDLVAALEGLVAEADKPVGKMADWDKRFEVARAALSRARGER